MNQSNTIIKIDNLNKSFGAVKAVKDLSFQVKKGELFAFLGVNGAGKSTTISIICGQLQKDSGTVLVNGMNADHSLDETKRSLFLRPILPVGDAVLAAVQEVA